MPSSVIRRFVYDETEGNLWVEFTTGRRYVYLDVPHDVAETFRGAFSKGVYFNTRIRDRFPFREVLPRRRSNPILNRLRDYRRMLPMRTSIDLQEPLDGPAVGGRHHLVRL